MIAYAIALVLLLATIAHVQFVVMGRDDDAITSWCIEGARSDSGVRALGGFAVFVIVPLLTGMGSLLALVYALTTL